MSFTKRNPAARVRGGARKSVQLTTANASQNTRSLPEAQHVSRRPADGCADRQENCAAHLSRRAHLCREAASKSEVFDGDWILLAVRVKRIVSALRKKVQPQVQRFNQGVSQ
jgi:hypothetical protein